MKRILYLWFIILFVVACSGSKNDPKKESQSRYQSSLPLIKESPQFTATNQSGTVFFSDSLRGNVWLAYFFFSSCGGPCPEMNKTVAELQQQFTEKKIHFVGISVDPETDTPEVLKTYQQRFTRNTANWAMLTTPLDSVKTLAIKGFQLMVGSNDDPNLHSTRFVLIDSKGIIRGYYDGLDADKRTEFQNAIADVLKEIN